MSTSKEFNLSHSHSSAKDAGRLAAAVLVIAWKIVRLPALALLLVLEPVFRFVCFGLALLGVLATLFFKLVGPADFPWVTMLTISLVFAMAPFPYYAALRFLSR